MWTLIWTSSSEAVKYWILKPNQMVQNSLQDLLFYYFFVYRN